MEVKHTIANGREKSAVLFSYKDIFEWVCNFEWSWIVDLEQYISNIKELNEDQGGGYEDIIEFLEKQNENCLILDCRQPSGDHYTFIYEGKSQKDEEIYLEFLRNAVLRGRDNLMFWITSLEIDGEELEADIKELKHIDWWGYEGEILRK